MSYRFIEEIQGLNAALTYALTSSDELDQMSLEMLIRNSILGLVPLSSSSMDGVVTLRYNITGMKKLSSIFGESISKSTLLGALLDICDVFESMANYMLDENTILLDVDRMYVHTATGHIQLVCLPLMNISEQTSLHDFVKQIMFTARFDPTEDCSYVAQIMNYLNTSGSFTAHELRALVQKLMTSTYPKASAQAAAVSSHSNITKQHSSETSPSIISAASAVQPAPQRPAVSIPQSEKSKSMAASVQVSSFSQAAKPIASANVSAQIQSATPGFAVPGVPTIPPTTPQSEPDSKELKRLDRQQAKKQKEIDKAAVKTDKKKFSLFGFGKKKEPLSDTKASLPGTPIGMAIPGNDAEAMAPEGIRPHYSPAFPSRAQVKTDKNLYEPPKSNLPVTPVQPISSKGLKIPVAMPINGVGYCTVCIIDPNAVPMIAPDIFDGTEFPSSDDTMMSLENDATELADSIEHEKTCWIRCRATGEASRISKCLFVLGRYGEPKHRADGSIDYPADCTIRTSDRGISRRHAAVLFYGGQFYLADISSRHETYLNGMLIEHEESAQMAGASITFTRAYPLKNGDIIRLRSEEFLFEER